MVSGDTSTAEVRDMPQTKISERVSLPSPLESVRFSRQHELAERIVLAIQENLRPSDSANAVI